MANETTKTITKTERRCEILTELHNVYSDFQNFVTPSGTLILQDSHTTYQLKTLDVAERQDSLIRTLICPLLREALEKTEEELIGELMELSIGDLKLTCVKV